FATCDGACLLFCVGDTYCFLIDHDKHLFQKVSTSSLCSPTLSHGFLCRVFRGEIATTTEAMERVMKETFRDRLTLHNIVKPMLIPCYNYKALPCLSSHVSTSWRTRDST
ncbi:unnamed protein product, partial [Musa textilis]